MEANDTLHEETDVTLQFQHDLESLLLEAFAKGAEVEGNWDIADTTETIPGWTIEISKSAEADISYDPEFIE